MSLITGAVTLGAWTLEEMTAFPSRGKVESKEGPWGVMNLWGEGRGETQTWCVLNHD